MGTQIIVNARRRQVIVSTSDGPGEKTTIFAVDLIGDTWDDYLYFIEQAQRAEEERSLRRRNRYVRTAVAALFSHLDGVASEVFSLLLREERFRPFTSKRPEYTSLSKKIEAITRFLARERTVELPELDLEMKLLRDIVNHPSITKDSRRAPSGETLLYDGATVYGISVEELVQTGRAIDSWATAACTATGYERFCDTKSVCEDLGRELLDEAVAPEEF